LSFAICRISEWRGDIYMLVLRLSFSAILVENENDRKSDIEGIAAGT
jgi:hypothetical protein